MDFRDILKRRRAVRTYDPRSVLVIRSSISRCDDTFPPAAKSAFNQRRKPRSEVVRWERWT